MLKSLHSLKNVYILVPTNKLKHKTMLKFKKKFSGEYESKNERYTFTISKQDISKEWILSIRDHYNKDCLTDTTYATYNNKKYCVEHANYFNK